MVVELVGGSVVEVVVVVLEGGGVGGASTKVWNCSLSRTMFAPIRLISRNASTRRFQSESHTSSIDTSGVRIPHGVNVRPELAPTSRLPSDDTLIRSRPDAGAPSITHPSAAAVASSTTGHLPHCWRGADVDQGERRRVARHRGVAHAQCRDPDVHAGTDAAGRVAGVRAARAGHAVVAPQRRAAHHQADLERGPGAGPEPVVAHDGAVEAARRRDVDAGHESRVDVTGALPGGVDADGHVRPETHADHRVVGDARPLRPGLVELPVVRAVQHDPGVRGVDDRVRLDDRLLAVHDDAVDALRLQHPIEPIPRRVRGHEVAPDRLAAAVRSRRREAACADPGSGAARVRDAVVEHRRRPVGRATPGLDVRHLRVHRARPLPVDPDVAQAAARLDARRSRCSRQTNPPHTTPSGPAATSRPMRA